MQNKFKVFLSKSAFAIFCALYGFVAVSIIFNNVSFDFNIPVIMVAMGCFAAAAAVACMVLRRYEDFFIKHRYKFLAVVCVAIFAVQFVVSKQMAQTVLYDYEKVLNGAMIWATKGDVAEFDIYRQYLRHYPHQLGIFLIQQFIFKLSLAIGFNDLFIAACVAGQIMMCIMTVTSFMYLDENYSGHRALFYLLLTAMYFPVYFQSNVAYTDTYSIWGIPCILLFASRALKAEKATPRIIYSVLAGALTATAIQVKTTAAIVVVALVIQAVVKGCGKKDMAVFAVMLAGLVAVNGMFGLWENTVIDEEDIKESTPVTHWIMMGLQGDGTYSAYDEWSITFAVPAEERVARNLEVIKERLEKMGPDGYMQLLYRKTCRTFGSGDAELYYTYLYSENATPTNTVYEIVYHDGRFFPVFRIGAQAVYLLTIVLGVLGGALMLTKKDDSVSEFVPHISLIGFWMFMMLWESNHRQLINQWSLFFMVAAIGLYNIWQVLPGRKGNK